MSNMKQVQRQLKAPPADRVLRVSCSNEVQKQNCIQLYASCRCEVQKSNLALLQHHHCMPSTVRKGAEQKLKSNCLI